MATKHSINKRCSESQRGFTLVEISVVIVIASILIAGAISIATTQIENSRIKSTQDKQEAVRKSIITFLSHNQRLPCPAVDNLAQGNANYGVEAATPGTCVGTTQFIGGANRNARGIIPWVSLGLDDDATIDGFGRRFTYQVLLSQTAAGSASGAGLIGNISIMDDVAGAVINPLDPGVAIILSHGNDGYGAVLPETGIRTAVGPAAYVNTRENTDNDLIFIVKQHSYDPDNNPQFLYDDILMWLKPSDINSELIELGVLSAPGININQQLTAIRNTLLAAVAADNADPDGGGIRTLSRKLPFADCTGVPDGTADINCFNGVVPWVTLGLDQSTAVDPWGTYINYVVPNALAATGVTLTTPAAGPPKVVLTVAGADAVMPSADDTVLNVDVAEIRGSLLSSGVNFDNP